MTSKITEAIKQLNHGINSLNEATPAIYDTIKEKERQIGQFQKEYFKAHPETISGLWNMDISSDNTYEHVRLFGWSYDDEYWETEGVNHGNKLAAAVRSPDDEQRLTVSLPSEYKKPSGNTYTPSVNICFHGGEITINFYYFNDTDFFHFLKEHGILVKTSIIDERIDGFNSRLQELKYIKDSILAAGVTEAPQMIFDNCDAAPRELLMHSPTGEGVQFNAEEVSTLHKHSGDIYETLTNAISKLDNLPVDVEIVKAATHELFYVQSELDNLADEIVNLDTNDEPADLGMAGSVYWNLIQGAINHLDGTINYIEAQDIPLFAEVHYRLKKLVEILQRCSDEFGDTYLGGNYDNE